MNIKAQIDSRNKSNATGIHVVQGRIYRYQAVGFWYDAWIKAGINGGPSRCTRSSVAVTPTGSNWSQTSATRRYRSAPSASSSHPQTANFCATRTMASSRMRTITERLT